MKRRFFSFESGVLRVELILFLGMLLISSCAKKQQNKTFNVQRSTFNVTRTTPVKNQMRSQSCWIYAMLATIEQNHLAVDDSVNLSAAWLERHYLREQTIARYLRGDIQRVTTRGIAPMVVTLLMRYGAMPYDAYRPRNGCDMQVLARRLARLADVCRTRRTGLEYLTARIDDTLDRYMGPAPRYAFMFGTEYTPTQFAHSLLLPRDYIALTSFTHHPFGTRFPIELTDNAYSCEVFNVPLDTMMHIVRNAVEAGFSVCWEGKYSAASLRDESEDLSLSTEKDNVQRSMFNVQRDRQAAFERFETTDDHAMAIVGLGKSASGTPIYIAKNSWGKDYGDHGFVSLTEQYLRQNTILVVVPRAAMPGIDALFSVEF